MANYLVTGGCGFIGSHLVNKLVAEGHRVAVMGNLSVGNAERVPLGAELIVEDLANADKVNALVKEADGVFHLAAVASVEKCNNDWAECHSTNATGTINVFQGARAAPKPVPVVWASSAAVYGVQKGAMQVNPI